MQKGAPSVPQDLPTEDVLRRIRIPFVQRATLTRRSESEDVFVIDVGLAGVFVEHPEALPVGEAVVIRFPLPGNEIPLVARCRVAWRHQGDSRLVSKALPPGIGLEFVELPEKDQTRIREYVENHCRQNPRVRRFLRHWPEAEREGDDP
jgi:hypothetical protein